MAFYNSFCMCKYTLFLYFTNLPVILNRVQSVMHGGNTIYTILIYIYSSHYIYLYKAYSPNPGFSHIMSLNGPFHTCIHRTPKED